MVLWIEVMKKSEGVDFMLDHISIGPNIMNNLKHYNCTILNVHYEERCSHQLR